MEQKDIPQEARAALLGALKKLGGQGSPSGGRRIWRAPSHAAAPWPKWRACGGGGVALGQRPSCSPHGGLPLVADLPTKWAGPPPALPKTLHLRLATLNTLRIELPGGATPKAQPRAGGNPGLLGQLNFGKRWVVIPAPEVFADAPRLSFEPSGCQAEERGTG